MYSQSIGVESDEKDTCNSKLIHLSDLSRRIDDGPSQNINLIINKSLNNGTKIDFSRWKIKPKPNEKLKAKLRYLRLHQNTRMSYSKSPVGKEKNIYRIDDKTQKSINYIDMIKHENGSKQSTKHNLPQLNQ